MNISALIKSLIGLAGFAAACFLIVGPLFNINNVSDITQYLAESDRRSSGVTGQKGEASHTVTAIASIAPLEGYDYAGQLDATITFTDASGEDTVFDLNYPADYNMFYDGFGPLWLSTWRNDMPNHPDVSPVLGNSCLQTIRNENLAPNVRYQTGYKEYIVCRILDEQMPDTQQIYDIANASPAVIGVIWTSLNHQPIDYPRERCVAEIRIWSTEIAKPGDRFMACVFVIDEDPQQVEIYTFELTEDRIIEIGGESEAWSRKRVETRDANRLVQYRFMQEWLENPQARQAAVDRAYAYISENLDQVRHQRESQFEGVEQKEDIINFTFSEVLPAEMASFREGSSYGEERHLYFHIRNLICGSDERAALLAFQENVRTFKYDLYQRDGKPRTLFSWFPNFNCR